MKQKRFPVIDPIATGKNIVRLRQERGLSVRDLQAYFGFDEPQAIYKWQWGKTMPSVDNLYALGALLEVPMEDIIVPVQPQLNLIVCEQQASACCSAFLWLFWVRQKFKFASSIFVRSFVLPFLEGKFGSVSPNLVCRKAINSLRRLCRPKMEM